MSNTISQPIFNRYPNVRSTRPTPPTPPPPPPPPQPSQENAPPLQTNRERQPICPELDDIYYMYTKSMIEYLQSVQRVVETTSHIQSIHHPIFTEIRCMNINMQSCHNLTKQCIDLIQTLYLSRLNLQNNTPTQQQQTNTTTGFRPWTTTSSVYDTPPPPTRAQTTVRPLSQLRRDLGSYYIDLTRGTTNQTQNTNSIGLTNNQIDLYTEVFTWTGNESSTDPSGNICPISLEEFQVGDDISRIRACNHQFKRPFLLRWFQRNHRCPVCRRDVTELPAQPVQPVQPEREENEDELNEEDPIENNITQPPPPLPQTTEEESQSGVERLLERFFTNELTQIINDDVSNILREIIPRNTNTTSTTSLPRSIEVFQEIIPIDLEYRIQYDASGSSI